MPRPSSATVSTRNVPSLKRPRLRAWSASSTTSPVDTRTQWPKPRVASTALPTRFSSTWRSCVLSMTTRSAAVSSETDSSISLPTIWRSSGSADVTSSSTDSSVGAMVSRRA